MSCSIRGSRDLYSSCGDVGVDGGQSRVSKGVAIAASLQTRVIAINNMVFKIQGQQRGCHVAICYQQVLVAWYDEQGVALPGRRRLKAGEAKLGTAHSSHLHCCDCL